MNKIKKKIAILLLGVTLLGLSITVINTQGTVYYEEATAKPAPISEFKKSDIEIEIENSEEELVDIGEKVASKEVIEKDTNDELLKLDNKITETTEITVEEIPLTVNKMSNEELAKLVVDGQYGNGEARKLSIEQEGYNYNDVKKEVSKILETTSKKTPSVLNKSNDKIAQKESNKEIGKVSTSRTMKASAYSAQEKGLSRYTANGTDLIENPRVIAVDPKVIPLGTKVEIEGYGTYVAADTGGAIKGDRIDIHFETAQECERFGRKDVKLTILR